MLDFTALAAKATRQGLALVALDCGVDTTTPAVKRWLTCLPRSHDSSGEDR
jgi:hypothetical protein